MLKTSLMSKISLALQRSLPREVVQVLSWESFRTGRDKVTESMQFCEYSPAQG